MVLSVHCCGTHVALNNVKIKNIIVETQQLVALLSSCCVSLVNNMNLLNVHAQCPTRLSYFKSL